MKNFIKSHRFLSGLLSVFISVFLVAIGVYAATTIGTNIETAGTLNVTGLATFDHATSTSATTTDYLYVGTDITEPSGWDFSGGDLIVSGLAYFHTKATSTAAFAVGAGTIDNLDMAGGDLYVLDDAEIDGDITVAGEITSTGSTTASIINMTSIKFTPVATPTPVVTGECFMDNGPNTYGVHCYSGSAWEPLYTE